ncbi:sterol desaturase family protein [Emticicia sp. SJ17W-69]|uniref:sterol desaturase family protein n=1 Tax=Emticicia sp. SJ17W-69 TaxID=3421657 RepID=UPI003EBCE281
MLLPDKVTQMFMVITAASFVRYFVIAGAAYLIWYILLKNKVSNKKIQIKFPKNTDYQREILYSMLTFLIFGVVGVALYNTKVRPYTLTYYKISDYGWGYYILSFFLTLIIHDTYFYWMHRLMHHPKLFKYFHKIHHQSTNPSPWTSFSFQPLEGFVEAGIFIIFAFVLPLHPSMILIFLLFMTTYNVYGHLGWELIPKGGNTHWFWKWLNSSVMHNQHHHYFKNNYGLYFSFWDRTMKTIDERYDAEFTELKERPKKTVLSV